MEMLLGSLASMMVDPVTGNACKCVRCLCVGHGGPGCARYVRDNLLNNLLDHPRFVSDLNLAVGAVMHFRDLSAFRFCCRKGIHQYRQEVSEHQPLLQRRRVRGGLGLNVKGDRWWWWWCWV